MRALFSFKSTNNTRIIFHEIFLLLFIILIFESSCAYGRNGKYLKAQGRQHNYEGDEVDDGWEDSSLGLMGLFEEDEGMTTKVYSNGFISSRKRTIRSPLDDEIDEVEDSDEEDDEEESSSEKKTTTTINPSVPPTVQIANKHSANNQAVHVNANASNPITVHGSMNLPKSTTNNATGKALSANATVGSLPPAFQIKPSGNMTGTKPATGGLPFIPTAPHGAPQIPGKLPPHGTPHSPGKVPPHGVPPFPGKLPPGVPPFPGKLPPHGVPPFPGKLPPHLLKNLPKPKPPPKKGELYLPEDYNNLVIPKLNLGKLIGIDAYSAVPVLVFLNIRSVRDIDETQETLTLDLDLVIEWVDGFLFDPISAITARQADITLNPIFLKKIWRPDIYIDEIVKVKRTSLMSKPLKLKFNPSNGFISYTTRLSVQLSCDMLYFYYPADTHRCEFTFRSYSYFGKDMELSWLGTGVYLQDPYDPNFDLQVESIDRIKLPQTFRKLTNDTFDGLRFTILARRKLSFHMVQTYLPSIFFIVITWLCFLVPARMVEARIGISMTTLLTLTSMFASVRESTPIVSYVKAIDIWMVFCIFFVFLTLLEFATFVWLRSRREDAEQKKLDDQRKLQDSKSNGNEKDTKASLQRRISSESIQLQKYEKFAEFTEKFAFLIFSIVFLMFNVIYWSWLLIASDYFDWSVNSTLNGEVEN